MPTRFDAIHGLLLLAATATGPEGGGERVRRETDRAILEYEPQDLGVSHSLTKHLVEAANLDTAVRVLSSGEPEALLAATRRSEEEWKAAWLAAIR